MKAISIIKHVVGHPLSMVDNEKVFFEFLNSEEITIEYDGCKRMFVRFDNEWYAEDPTDEEDDVVLFTTSDLMLFPDFSEKNECIDCNGSGVMQIDARCSSTYRLDCCGACYDEVDCDCENRFYNL